MVRVTGVHNDAYIEKTVGCSTRIHDVTGQVTVAVTLWTCLSDGRVRISDEIAVLFVKFALYEFRYGYLIWSQIFPSNSFESIIHYRS
jgi:hypothetical protein